MTPIQVLGGLFLLFAISRVVLRWRDHSLSVRELVFWVLVFGGILSVLLAPEMSSGIARYLGIGRGTDVVVYTSVVVLYYLVFRIYVRLENVQHQLTLLLRELALMQSMEPSPIAEAGPEAEEASAGTSEAQLDS
jgi:hypothetical protein